MIDLSIYNQQAPEIEELYISSELYPILLRDGVNCSGSASGSFLTNVSPFNVDEVSVSGSIAGINTLLSVVVNYTLETDQLNVTGSIFGASYLVDTINQSLDVDNLNVAGQISGANNLVSIIEHVVYDTDQLNVAGSITGSHTLT